MKNILKNKYSIILISLIIGITIGWFIQPSHDHIIKQSDHQASESTVFTCSMHPQIRQNEPGQCPLCGMDLIPLESDGGEASDLQIKMSPTAMQLAGVQTAIVKKEKPVKAIRLSGKIQANEKAVSSQTTHISGRIESLLVNATGEFVSKGRVIAEVYSPELVTAQQEFFEAQKMQNTNPTLFKAAKEKLKNWKLSEAEIEKILSTGQVTQTFPIKADRSGIVLTKRVNVGDYVKQGNSLYEVADLSTLWVLFDVYESDLNWVKKGDDIKFTVQSLPGQQFTGTISFIDPIIHSKTRVARARVVMNNPSGLLKPEMFVAGQLESPLKDGAERIVIPSSAVMWTGEKSLVYIKSQSNDGVEFLMRQVTLGPSLGDDVVIESGLQEGEEIAIHGTFSIDAAAQLAGKPSMMNPTNDSKVKTSNGLMISDGAKRQLAPLFTSYLELKNALVNDDFAASITAANQFQSTLGKINMSLFKGDAHTHWMEHSALAKKAITTTIESKDLDGVRANFVTLSAQMVIMARLFEPNSETLFIQHCPMANDDKGADWLSTENEIKNPYYGAAMLKCGEVKETIN